VYSTTLAPSLKPTACLQRILIDDLDKDVDNGHFRLKATQKRMQVRLRVPKGLWQRMSLLLSGQSKLQPPQHVDTANIRWFGWGPDVMLDNVIVYPWLCTQDLIRKSGSNTQLVLIVFLIVVLIVLMIFAFY
jgi:hypothetical protein